MPPLKDARGWSIFCLGRDINRSDVNIGAAVHPDESSNIVGMDTRVEENDDDDAQADEDENYDDEREDLELVSDVSPTRTGFPEWNGETAVAPTTSVVLQFDQVMTQKLLNFHTSWLETRHVNSDIKDLCHCFK